MKVKALFLALGLLVGVVGSAAGLLVSPQLHGIEREFRCVSCHGQIHGAVQIDSLPYNALVLVTGDVAKPGYVTVNDVFPYRTEQPKGIALAEFVRVYGGATDFSQIVLVSTDGGRVALDKEYVTDKSLLLPYLEGVRFADENQHVSTWLKGISEIVVVGAGNGEERKVTVDGKSHTMGELLAGSLVSVSTEAGNAMKANLETDEVFRGEYAHIHRGAPIAQLVERRDFASLTAVDAKGKETQIPREKAADAVLTIVDGKTTLVVPSESRRGWVFDVAEITSRQ